MSTMGDYVLRIFGCCSADGAADEPPANVQQIDAYDVVIRREDDVVDAVPSAEEERFFDAAAPPPPPPPVVAAAAELHAAQQEIALLRRQLEEMRLCNDSSGPEPTLLSPAPRDDSELASFLSTVPWLSGLSHEQIVQVVAKSELVDFHRGETALKQNERGDSLWIVQAGAFVAEKDGEAVKEYAAGGTFGEVALLTGTMVRSASVTAFGGPARCVRISRQGFSVVLENASVLARLRADVQTLLRAHFSSGIQSDAAAAAATSSTSVSAASSARSTTATTVAAPTTTVSSDDDEDDEPDHILHDRWVGSPHNHIDTSGSDEDGSPH